MRLLFFRFKQKTSYEMRISDWSSDVCSSDLGQLRAPEPAVVPAGGEPPGRWIGQLRDELPGRRVEGIRRAAVDPDGDRREVRDRKSVASGKSVSVRVDLGGRRTN